MNRLFGLKWFYNLKTSTKLVSAFFIVSLIMVFVGYYGIMNLGKLNKSLDDMYTIRLVPVSQTSEMKMIYQDLSVNMLQYYLAQTDLKKAELLSTIEANMREITQLLEAYKREFANARHGEIYNAAVQAFQEFKASYYEMLELSETGTDEQFLETLNGEFEKTRQTFSGYVDELIAFNLEMAEKSSIDGKALYDNSRNVTIMVIVFAFLVSFALGLFISQVISRPLRKVVGVIEKVATGDLREVVGIDTKDEVGKLAQSINHMVYQLRDVVNTIVESAENVSASSQQISASTEEIASSSSDQASAASTISELFKHLSDAINAVAASAEQASELSNRTMNVAQEGGKVVQSSIMSMDQVSRQMSVLEEDSNKIGAIIEVIDEIADQTNLLALNAAIEAARAGEQGRGFAVVAEEVRKLAERSSQATKEIAAIIKAMQSNTQQSVKVVQDGVNLSQQTGTAFETILNMVNETSQRIMEIAAATEEQAAQSSDVLTSIESITASTEEAAASSEETASTAQSLATLAERLNQAVAIFKVK